MVTVLFNSNDAESVASAAIAKMKFPAVELVDLSGWKPKGEQKFKVKGSEVLVVLNDDIKLDTEKGADVDILKADGKDGLAATTWRVLFGTKVVEVPGPTGDEELEVTWLHEPKLISDLSVFKEGLTPKQKERSKQEQKAVELAVKYLIGDLDDPKVWGMWESIIGQKMPLGDIQDKVVPQDIHLYDEVKKYGLFLSKKIKS